MRILTGATISLFLAFAFAAVLSGCSKEQTAESAAKQAAQVESHNLEKQVAINGKELAKEQIAEFKNTYGAEPQPGDYWYDTMSGLYGVVGYPAFGYLLPGHDFGPLARNASNGQTGVIINGRDIPQTEWAVLSTIIGSWIQPAEYWLDAAGNAGYVGSPLIFVNLYAAAQLNGFTGTQGGGDNFWSGRFGRGNYDTGNQRGYVSVPGHGPVGYGF